MKTPLGGYIMVSVFSYIIGAAFLIMGFAHTFSETWRGWGEIVLGLWIVFAAYAVWELVDKVEKLEEK